MIPLRSRAENQIKEHRKRKIFMPAYICSCWKVYLSCSYYIPFLYWNQFSQSSNIRSLYQILPVKKKNSDKSSKFTLNFWSKARIYFGYEFNIKAYLNLKRMQWCIYLKYYIARKFANIVHSLCYLIEKHT